MGKERWASRLGLVLAMAGNAVGLGNFLRFPAQAAKNGGGAFLIPYIVALLVVGLPLIWVEWTIGRHGGRFGHHSSPGAFDAMGRKPYWKFLGVFGLWANLMIAAYYLYIETWTLAYSGYSLIGGFSRTEPTAFFAQLTGERAGEIVAVSGLGLTLFFLCIVLNVFILSRGLAKGIELVSKIGMPLLILFGIALAIRGLLIEPGQGPHAVEGGDPEAIESPFVGLNFLWEPKFASLADPSVWLAAAGQIFFTLSIGMGSIHCYASYLREKDDVVLTGASAAWTNELCEVVIGGSILLPISVAYLGLEKVQSLTAGGSGFNLGFFTLPTLFQKWGPLAEVAGFMWFGLLFFAAITSSLAMGQPIMAFLQTEFGLTRSKSALAFGAMLVPFAAAVACLHSKSFNDEFDFWAGSFGLVVFALIETVLFAWVFGMQRGWQEMTTGAQMRIPRAFYYVIKYVTPVFLALILFGFAFKPAAGWGKYAALIVEGGQMPAWDWAGDGMIGKLLHRDLDAEYNTAMEALAKEKAAYARDPKNASAPKLTEQQLRHFYFENLRFWRTIDRLAMVLAFAGFAMLVGVAWRKRNAKARHGQH